MTMGRRTNVSRSVNSRLCVNFFLLLLAGLAFLDGASGHEPPASGLAVAQRREVRIPVRNFQLIDQNGRAFEFSTVANKTVVLAFAYTTCADICPLITAAMKQVQTELNQVEGRSVYFVTITTDPEIDNPKVLAAYAKRYGADLSNWAFLTGEEGVLRKVWQNFGVRVIRKKRGLVDHTALTAVIDHGTMRFAYYGTSPDPKGIIQDIRSLLAYR
jgi:protein SCO1/2